MSSAIAISTGHGPVPAGSTTNFLRPNRGDGEAPPKCSVAAQMGQAVRVGVRGCRRSLHDAGQPGPFSSRMLESWKVRRARRGETQRIRGARRAIWAAVSPPRSRLGWILMTHWQNSHVTFPSSWISVVLDRPQLRQCQFRTTVFMDARFLAEGRRRTRTKEGAGPSGGSEETSLSRARRFGGYAADRGGLEEARVSSTFRTFSMSIGLTR